MVEVEREAGMSHLVGTRDEYGRHGDGIAGSRDVAVLVWRAGGVLVCLASDEVPL